LLFKFSRPYLISAGDFRRFNVPEPASKERSELPQTIFYLRVGINNNVSLIAKILILIRCKGVLAQNGQKFKCKIYALKSIASFFCFFK